MNKKPEIFTFYSFKGGTGKSSMTILTANCLAAAGNRVLVIDFDLNNSASFYYLDNDNEKDIKNIARALQGKCLLDYVLPSSVNSIDIIQSDLNLVDLRTINEKRLKSLIPTLEDVYDYIVIDCSPAYDNLVLNTLHAADYILTPTLLSQFDYNTALFVSRKLTVEVEKLDSWYLFFNQYESQYERFEHSVQADYLSLFTSNFENVLDVRIPKTSLVRQYVDRGERLTPHYAKKKLYNSILDFCTLITNKSIKPTSDVF